MFIAIFAWINILAAFLYSWARREHKWLWYCGLDTYYRVKYDWYDQQSSVRPRHVVILVQLKALLERSFAKLQSAWSGLQLMVLLGRSLAMLKSIRRGLHL